MSKLKIAVSDSCPDCFTTQRECIYINESRNIDVAAIVLSLNDVTCGKLDEIDANIADFTTDFLNLVERDMMSRV